MCVGYRYVGYKKYIKYLNGIITEICVIQIYFTSCEHFLTSGFHECMDYVSVTT